MKTVSRRNFIKGGKNILAGLSAGAMANLSRSAQKQVSNAKGVTAVIPMPIQVVVDDVGWWSGRDGSKQQEPYRTGIQRDHVPEDYEAIVRLGRALDIRPQAAMILCEWDRDNILRKLPTSTWMGANWDNRKWVGPWLERAADIIRGNAQHFEMTMHGIGHEFWTDGKPTRAEWADSTGTMRPPDQVEAHLDFFAALMRQNRLEPFPSSFVPTAFLHGFGPTDGYGKSIAAILSRRGIVYINTPFTTMQHRERVTDGVFGMDGAVITVDRGEDLFDWNRIGVTPAGELRGPTCGMHWPHLLHPDPRRNSEIVDGWVRFLKPYQDRLDTLLAPNSESFRQQLAHHVRTQLEVTDRAIELDFAKVDGLPEVLSRKQLTVKVQSPGALRLEPDGVKVTSQTVAQRDGFHQYTVALERIPARKRAELKIS